MGITISTTEYTRIPSVSPDAEIIDYDQIQPELISDFLRMEPIITMFKETKMCYRFEISNGNKWFIF